MVLCDTGGTVRFEMGASMIGNTAVGGGDGGGLYCSQCGQVQMDHAQVLNNSAGGNGGGLALVANGATWTSITSSNLSFNHAALDGGAFNVTGGATVLVNNSFVGNYVEGRGGAISCLWAWFGVSPFQHDQAATSVSSEGVRISLSAANAMVQGQTEASTNATGFAHADSFIFGAVPETYPLELSLPDYYPQVPNVTILVLVNQCSNGFVLQNNTCNYCTEPQYSFDPLGSDHSHPPACDEPCPDNALCSGGQVMVPQAGFWMSSPFSDSMVACPYGAACVGSNDALKACLQPGNQSPNPLQQDSCQLEVSMESAGPTSFMTKQCKDGYHGYACTSCVRNSTHTFGKVGSLKCQLCRSPSLIVVTYIASTILVLMLLCYTILVTLQENTEARNTDEDGGDAAPKESVKVSELLRALTLWLQYISLLGQANIPAPSTEDHSAPGCATHSVSDWDSNMASEKGRQASGGIHWLSTAYSCYATHHVAEDKLGRRILVSLLTVVFYYYPSTLTNTLSIFTCYRLDTPATLKKYPGNARAKWHGGYWLPDMQRPCWTGWHATHAVPLGVVLMLGCICIFLLPILLLFKHRHKLKSTPLKYRFGFIYRPYRRRFWFWDSIVLMQTFALASAQVFALALSAYFHLTIMLMILVVGFAILAFFQPFEAPLSQNTQFAGMLAVLVTAVGCLYLIDTSNSIETSKGRKAALDADGVLLMSNAALLELQWSNTSSSPAIVYEQSNA
ncbi:hypothetical protein WJX82_003308 [Trebouxia sp. C0006]